MAPKPVALNAPGSLERFPGLVLPELQDLCLPVPARCGQRAERKARPLPLACAWILPRQPDENAVGLADAGLAPPAIA
eukprot:2475854-Lingulodinium_polyedra.AAC.1